jgi:hypothetical protein
MAFTVRAPSDKNTSVVPRSAAYRGGNAVQEASMSSPEEPQSGPPVAGQPEQPTAESAPVTPPAPQPSAPPAAPQQAAPPPYPYPAGDPFAPVPRAPKVPWIAPQRKGAAIAISIGAALVLLGGGVGIGAAAFGHDDHHGPSRQFDRHGPYDGQGQFPGYPGGPGFPNRPHQPQQPPATPSPAPSKTS